MKFKNESYPRLFDISKFIKYRLNQSFQTICLLLVSDVVYIFACKLSGLGVSNIVLEILLGFLFLVVLELLIFIYRVKKGWYGNNESEARQIMDFYLKSNLKS